jgi:uracil-DNA glycosylase family 4
MSASKLRAIEREVVACRACPRLVAWREKVAAEKVFRYSDQTYWGKPVPGFGDPSARILVVGLAPAAHGGNRTGRIFTGDRSGDFLFGALHRAGLANQATSSSRTDGLALDGVFVSAINRCAPPGNKPAPAERDACLPFLGREMEALNDLKVVIALGAYAWDGVLRVLPDADALRPKPKFAHASEVCVGAVSLMGCYHPSQQNTFTGKLTDSMMDSVMKRAVDLALPLPQQLGGPPPCAPGSGR